ncbi:chloramphenicol phosphotransferase CPT family protein [Halobacillus sp. Marseille-Q1614]|uniref:chloramphenicol phosphotransferase CPT family protein n=1 Tax=Halobacillus sp. Marseille-Q1614 TaxID=2709134 RepID=UPI0015706393|nr:AAA family ATPase [Halobacillus sp. Marseille-Q1614]
MQQGQIILLNGVSSSGKSTLAKQLASKLRNYFPLSIDDFDELIERMEDRTLEKLIPIPTEHFFHQTTAMFSDRGINLIVDQILHNDDTMKDAFTVLKDYPIFFVGVHCSLDELERREAARGDRTIGQAEKQLAYVHQQGEVYDVTVDTSQGEAADVVIKQLKSQKSAKGWKSTLKKTGLK